MSENLSCSSPRIALVAVNAKYSHSNLALLYLNKALSVLPAFKTGKATAEIIEWNINRPKKELLRILIQGEYTHCAFSAYIWNTSWLEIFLQDFRMLSPQTVIAMGGPEAVYRSDFWLNHRRADYILNGAAEHFASRLPELTKPESPEVLAAAPKPFAETLFPYDSDLIEALEGRLLYYEASRGCLFNCSYCLSSREDQRLDYRTPDQIKRELTMLSRFNGIIKFVDRTFNARPAVSHLIWNYIIEHPSQARYHFEIHPLLLTDQDFHLLEQLPPDTVQFEIGIQSTDPRILKAINRRGNWEKESAALKRLIALKNIHFHMDQIVGLPGDTPATAAKTMDQILDLEPEEFQMGFLKVLPGTPLAEDQPELGIMASAEPPYQVLHTPDLSFIQLSRFEAIETLIDLFLNRGYFRQTVSFIHSEIGSWHRFFESFLELGPDSPDLECRQWPYWGERILVWADRYLKDERENLIDTLRWDWSPFAKGQFFPDFIDYSEAEKESVRERRTRALTLAQKEFPQVSRGELNRAVLFVPRGSRLSPNGDVLLIRINKKIRRLPVS